MSEAGAGNPDAFMNLFDSQHGLVRNDRLLTDGLMAHNTTSVNAYSTASSSSSAASEASSTSPLPSEVTTPTFAPFEVLAAAGTAPVKTEHSYSMAGSDGDSIPNSPLSNSADGKLYYASNSI